MKRLHTFVIFLLLAFPGLISAQGSLNKANKLYDNLAYASAIPEYKKALKDDPNNAEALTRIAHCYRLINNTAEAENWYAKVVEIPNVNPVHLYYYAQALMSNGNYPDAEKWVNKYRELQGPDDRSTRLLESLHNINALYEDSSSFTVTRLTQVNSDQSDFCPVYYDKGIVFASSRTKSEIIQRTDDWTGLPFFTLYYAKGTDESFSKPEIFSSSITTKFNNGPVAFNKTQDEIYVTRNNIEDGKIKQSDSGIVKLKIYILKKVGKEWTKEVPFAWNSDNYHCAHPCLSPDGNKLYFSSDMPGGFGGMDLYVSVKENNKWTKPVNLGSTINTIDNDGFPFIDDRGGLFYASNGRGGLGGYDIFYAAKSNDSFSQPVNLGFPVNSHSDDFGWVQNDAGTSGYFTSNRDGKNENDDIYSFKRMSVILNVLVYDRRTKLPLPASSLRIIEAGTQKNIQMTDDSGTVNLFLTPGKTYRFIAEKAKYRSDTAQLESDVFTITTLHNISIPLQKKFSREFLEGKVVSNIDNTPVQGVEVKITNRKTGAVRTTTTDAKGIYAFDNLDTTARYIVEAKSDDCFSLPFDFPSIDITDDEAVDSLLILNCLVDLVKLKNIYYDLDKYAIREDAKPELNRLVTLMKSNPQIKIELRSHTDCRGSKPYNQRLSQLRAKAAVEYLTQNGIASSRMIARGYGESKLLNQCSCEGNQIIECTEEQHQANRRTEFKILSKNPDSELSQNKK